MMISGELREKPWSVVVSLVPQGELCLPPGFWRSLGVHGASTSKGLAALQASSAAACGSLFVAVWPGSGKPRSNQTAHLVLPHCQMLAAHGAFI